MQENIKLGSIYLLMHDITSSTQLFFENPKQIFLTKLRAPKEKLDDQCVNKVMPVLTIIFIILEIASFLFKPIIEK